MKHLAKVTSALILAVALPVLAACGSSPPKAAQARSFTDSGGYACASADAAKNGGLCPENPLASTEPSPSPVFTDPNGQTCAPSAVAGPGGAYCPGDEPQASGGDSGSPPDVTMTRQTDKVVFKVWGSGYPSIQYGSDSDNNSPKGGYGPLGDGVALPWSGSMTYDPNALYYAVSAQLQGSGDIRDSVTEVITTYCSDGSHKKESFPLASGHASGGYNIAQAEYADGDTGNAGQAESDAGC
jgi:hypothetical protein